jgi:hypothetical protein
MSVAARLVEPQNAPVCALQLIELLPKDFDRLYGEIASFLSDDGTKFHGALESQLLGSADKSRILIFTRFDSRHHWARAQWDQHLGQLLEEIQCCSQAIEFDLCCEDRFPSQNATVKTN